MQITKVRIDKIHPNKYNPNVVPADTLAKLRAEIAQQGLCEPIQVRFSPDGYEIVDGEHRWRICRDLGFQEIPCIIQDFSDNEAKIKTIQFNYLRGSAIPVKLASLIHDLSKEIKLEDLAKRLPYEELHLMDQLELLKLPEDFGKQIEEQAKKDEDEMPIVVSFVLYKSQLKVLEDAIRTVAEVIPSGAKNTKALALEAICSYFLETKGLKENAEAEA